MSDFPHLFSIRLYPVGTSSLNISLLTSELTMKGNGTAVVYAYVGLLSTNTSANNFTSDINLFVGPNWSLTAGFAIFVQISALLTNSALAFLLQQNPSLVTTFTIYPFYLSLVNILCSVFYDTINLLDSLYAVWWFGNSVCTLFQHGGWIIMGGMLHAHTLIALNRFWAMTFPASYRRYQKRRSALIVCLAVWVYLHVCLLPGNLLDL
ncbi:hypothetical protein RvY_16243 [Ramazzottius varieornatus]|uniref:G-protein coupled receptors family 1 profile domain-containing protein n=1 Tax=Ramazzottius varieornatus TaxID=947166 RepID=A0A1D1VXT8_RAMVA|nr:hypothetical protein RvY_16243 [Ramazzottius varieornatus]